VSWLDVGPLVGLPERGARVVRVGALDIAVFRTGANQVFALRDRCPHRGGPLSQGIVHGERVTCPLHDWVIDLRSGNAVGADTGCTRAFATRVADGRVAIDVPAEILGASAEARPVCEAAFDPRVGAVFERA
jgi:nitrite reductase (NADH) small subunit